MVIVYSSHSLAPHTLTMWWAPSPTVGTINQSPHLDSHVTAESQKHGSRASLVLWATLSLGSPTLVSNVRAPQHYRLVVFNKGSPFMEHLELPSVVPQHDLSCLYNEQYPRATGVSVYADHHWNDTMNSTAEGIYSDGTQSHCVVWHDQGVACQRTQASAISARRTSPTTTAGQSSSKSNCQWCGMQAKRHKAKWWHSACWA